MLINYRDHLGYIQVSVNGYGITFDTETGTALFEDGNGKEYRIPILNICSIMEG